jgi:hypothetical protein
MRIEDYFLSLMAWRKMKALEVRAPEAMAKRIELR